MRDNRALQIVASCAIVGSVATIYLSIGAGFGPGIDRGPHEATGVVMAQQALALLKPGGHVVVIARDTISFKNPASDIQLASFRRELSSHSVGISSIHTLQLDPLRPVEVPADDFFELLRKAAPADVLVSFMGPPLLTEAQCAQLGGGARPAVVAFCSGSLPEQVDLRALFEQGLLQAAVVTKRNVAEGSGKLSSVRDRVAQSFSLITSSNLAMLSPSTP